MKKVLLLLGALIVVSFFACGNGCILHTKELEIVITDRACIQFDEHHTSENYTTPGQESLFEDLDQLLDDHDLTRSQVIEAGLISATYQVLTLAGSHDWTVQGTIWVGYDDDEAVVVNPTIESLSSAMADPVAADLNQDGVDLINAAIADYLNGMNPVLSFWVDYETGDVDPTPTLADPLDFAWEGCLKLYVDFVDTLDVYDMFPAD
jgi:hypothetical protein